MKEHSDPIEFLIEFAWASGADVFVVNNAKDELRKLKQENINLKSIFDKPIVYGKTNDRFDLYDLRITNNPYNDQTKIIPLYSNKQEFLDGNWKGYDPYAKFSK